MLLNSLRSPARLSITVGLLLAGACAQSTSLIAQSRAAAAGPGVPAADEGPAGLPPFLLMVPGGSVEVGLKANMLFEASLQVVNPSRPGIAIQIAASKVETAIEHSASVLGRRKVDVPTFLLGKTPVTCRQYELYLQWRRKNGKPIRPPFGWWRFGRADDYNEKLTEINRLYPGDKLGPVLYWESNGADLPYRLEDERGRSIADHPVVHVDYREAQQFAAWLGMRLPSEAEWTRAARADGQHVWPWGLQGQTTDVFEEKALRDLLLFNSSDKVLKPVGSVHTSTGPYGHQDMFGQAWQIVSGVGYRPITGRDAFEDEWKQVQKEFARDWRRALKGDGAEPTLVHPPWSDERVLAKGGSFLSSGDPIQLLIDARANIHRIDVFESVGFRLAKSLRPGYDMLFSLLSGPHNTGKFDPQQEIALEGQIGAERYELAADGFPTAYHAVTMAPVNWLSRERDSRKALEATQQTPLLIGTLATTMPLTNPPAPAGHYSVLYRKEGVPRELQNAVKAGWRELDAMKGTDNKEPRKGGWREVIARFGITEEDVATKEWKNGPLFVRVDGFQVSIDRDVFLLHDNDGKVAAAIPATNKKPAVARNFAPLFALERSEQGKSTAKFAIGSPLTEKDSKQIVEFHFHVQLDCPPPGPDTPWRLPGN